MLEDTVHRLDGFVPLENILILTNSVQEESVRKACPMLPKANILAEPAKRDTAAAIALGAAWISNLNSNATMIVLPADHLIKDKEAFQNNLRDAVQVAESKGALITLGIQPTWACPGFGYIERGAVIDNDCATNFFEVCRFREKPNAELAETFLRKGSFLWNAGMFIWPIHSIVNEFSRHTPELSAFISRMHEAGSFTDELKKEFTTLPKISIDYAIMEKAHRVLVAEATFDWDDVGTWTAAAKYFENDGHGNRSNSPVLQIHSGNNIVFSSGKKTVGLIGVHDLIVIESDDAILVCNAHDAESIKTLVGKVPAELQ